jgi:ketosteroid isomerase-like protein
MRPEQVLPGANRASVAGENAEIVRRGYEAWNRGDTAAVLELVDPHFEWHESSEVPGGAHVYTREQFGSYLASLDRLWETFRFELQEVLTTGDEVLVDVLEVARGRVSGVEVTQRFVHVWTVRDGRARGMRAYREKDEALRAVGLAPS